MDKIHKEMAKEINRNYRSKVEMIGIHPGTNQFLLMNKFKYLLMKKQKMNNNQQLMKL